jgi:hypothetical protein
MPLISWIGHRHIKGEEVIENPELLAPGQRATQLHQ